MCIKGCVRKNASKPKLHERRLCGWEMGHRVGVDVSSFAAKTWCVISIGRADFNGTPALLEYLLNLCCTCHYFGQRIFPSVVCGKVKRTINYSY